MQLRNSIRNNGNNYTISAPEENYFIIYYLLMYTYIIIYYLQINTTVVSMSRDWGRRETDDACLLRISLFLLKTMFVQG